MYYIEVVTMRTVETRMLEACGKRFGDSRARNKPNVPDGKDYTYGIEGSKGEKHEDEEHKDEDEH